METTNEASEFNFEQSLKELEQLVEKMRKGDVPLDESLKLFEKGITLVRTCHTRLESAEKKVELLISRTDGVLERKPFDERVAKE
jgi:exodeoxyribonuclease VII small subunit